MTEAEFLRACRANSSGNDSSGARAVLVVAFVAAVMAGLLTSLSMGPVSAAGYDRTIVRAKARHAQRESLWSFWKRRRGGDAVTAQAVEPRAGVRVERVPVPQISSIEDLSATIHARRRSEQVQVAAAPPEEISKPTEVRRVLSTIGPDAAGRLAAADTGMRLVLQIGSFLEPANARALERRLSQHYASVYTSRYDHEGRVFHRVRISQFSGGEQLDAVEAGLRANGYTPLRILTGERTDLASHRR